MRTSLVFDAFYRIAHDEELVVAWPELVLGLDDYALAQHLASLIGYLGRAESIVIAHATDVVDGSLPVCAGAQTDPACASADVLASLSATEYAEARPVLLAQNRDKPKTKGRAAFEETIPPKLTDALQVDTSRLQAAGWSQPPAGRIVRYARPEVGPRPALGEPRRAPTDDPSRFSVARFVLAGRPLPPITDAVKIGEIFRRALMARVTGPIPAVLSGRNEMGEPLRDPQHAHAFFLPEDHDNDGFVDHLVLFARLGLPRTVRQAAETLRTLWIDDRRHLDAGGEDESGRREWRVALEGFGEPSLFGDSALLRRSRTWVSVTPYLRPRHLKGRDFFEETRAMVRAECERRGWIAPEVRRDGLGPAVGGGVRVGGSIRSVLAFHRFRSRRGLVQPDRTGLALRLEFPGAVLGPLALGFGCHFGLGLFRTDSPETAPL